MVPVVGLLFMFVIFPGHTRLRFRMLISSPEPKDVIPRNGGGGGGSAAFLKRTIT